MPEVWPVGMARIAFGGDAGALENRLFLATGGGCALCLAAAG
jgi:hypothetical protein